MIATLTSLAILAVGSAQAGPGRPTVELVALVASVAGDVTIRRDLDRSVLQGPLAPLAGLRQGDRVEGRGEVLAVCPDGSEVRFEPPRRIDFALCAQPTHHRASASASPDPGRWLTIDGAVIVQSGARDGAVKDGDLGRRVVLLSPACPRQVGKVAACADWWQAPTVITWLGVTGAETYVLTWSQAAAEPVRVVAAISCGTWYVDSLATDVPQCRTPWPRSWPVTSEPHELRLEAVHGRFRLLPGHDLSILRLHRDANTAGPSPVARSEGLSRALAFYRAGYVQPALAEVLRLPAAACQDWPPELLRIRSDLWLGSGLAPLADRDVDCLERKPDALPTLPEGDTP